MKKKFLYCLLVNIIMVFALSFVANAEFYEDTLTYNGVDYGKIIFSEQIEQQKDTFNIDYQGGGVRTVDWYYNNVAENTICTIVPTDFDGYIIPSICAYTKIDDVYTWNVTLEQDDDLPLVQLFANGQAQVGWGYGYKEFPVKYDSPTSFVFGYNLWKNPIHGDEYSYTFRQDGTLYVLQCEIYSSLDEHICTSYTPCFVNSREQTNQEISVLVNGEKISFDQPPIIIDGRTLVPVRAVFESLGVNVEWISDTQTVLAQKDGRTVTLKIDSNVMKIGNEEILLDVPAQIINNRTLVPARAVAEAFECMVDWDGSTSTVIINDK